MLTFWGIVTAVTVGGGIPIISGLWMFERRRSRKRNRTGKCAACGSDWGATLSSQGYLIQGRLVCQTCAETARRRLPRHFAILGIATAVATGGLLVGGEVTLMTLLPIGIAGAMTLGAVQSMKLANRSAQSRIAMGQFPELEAFTARQLEG
ncbi:MAG: hypothetical protein ACR2QM_13450 [Longimicrobiales bacterium]